MLSDVEVCSRLGAQACHRVHQLFSFGQMRKKYECLLAEAAATP
jgi:hypothetical protein